MTQILQIKVILDEVSKFWKNTIISVQLFNTLNNSNIFQIIIRSLSSHLVSCIPYALDEVILKESPFILSGFSYIALFGYEDFFLNRYTANTESKITITMRDMVITANVITATSREVLFVVFIFVFIVVSVLG